MTTLDELRNAIDAIESIIENIVNVHTAILIQYSHVIMGGIDMTTHMFEMDRVDEEGNAYETPRPERYELPPEYYFQFLRWNSNQVRIFRYRNPAALENKVLANFVLDRTPALLPVFGRDIQGDPFRILRWAIADKTDDEANKTLVATVRAGCEGIRDRCSIQLTLKAVVDKLGLDPCTTSFLLKEMRNCVLPAEVDRLFGTKNGARAAHMTPAIWVKRMRAFLN